MAMTVPRQSAFRAMPLFALLLLPLAGLLAGCVPAAPAPRPASAGDPERGRALMAQYQCGACHRVPGVEAARGTVAANLAGFGRRSYIAGQLPNRPAVLERWITDPQSVLASATMPSLGVSPGDARDIAAYLQGLE